MHSSLSGYKFIHPHKMIIQIIIKSQKIAVWLTAHIAATMLFFVSRLYVTFLKLTSANVRIWRSPTTTFITTFNAENSPKTTTYSLGLLLRDAKIPIFRHFLLVENDQPINYFYYLLNLLCFGVHWLTLCWWIWYLPVNCR